MKTFKLDNEPKLNTGFIIPENYFENFSANILENFPEKEVKTIALFSQKKTWLYAAAAVLVFALSIPIYKMAINKPNPLDDSTLENYIAYQSNISSVEIAEQIDEEDLETIEREMNINQEMIENEILDTKNIEDYILN